MGIRTDKSFALADGILTLRGRFAWAHDFDPDRSIAATFQTLPGASFVNGAAQASDSILVTASIEKNWLNGWSAAATFEGELSNVTEAMPARASCGAVVELRIVRMAHHGVWWSFLHHARQRILYLWVTLELDGRFNAVGVRHFDRTPDAAKGG